MLPSKSSVWLRFGMPGDLWRSVHQTASADQETRLQSLTRRGRRVMTLPHTIALLIG